MWTLSQGNPGFDGLLVFGEYYEFVVPLTLLSDDDGNFSLYDDIHFIVGEVPLLKDNLSRLELLHLNLKEYLQKDLWVHIGKKLPEKRQIPKVRDEFLCLDGVAIVFSQYVQDELVHIIIKKNSI